MRMIAIDKHCTGCGACAAVCPKGCITLLPNERGILYPRILQDQCVDCHACEKVCHRSVRSEKTDEPAAYAVRTNNEEYLQRSTSGGAFSALAESILRQGGAVYGCAWTEHLQARHVRITSLNGLYRLNGSKYVQSDCADAFLQVKNDLKSNLTVLFSGTPCQVAALKRYLGGDRQNLITVDVVCHGVTPQSFLDKYIRWYEKKHQIDLENYDFRSKVNGKWSLAGECSGKDIKTGRNIHKKIFYYKEFYYFYFLKGLAYRESCYSCKYANLNRPGDITLGDLWGAESLGLNYDVTAGCSLYLANSAKGAEALKQIDVNAKRIDLEQTVRLNRQLTEPSTRPSDYESTMAFLARADAEAIDRAFRKQHRKARFTGFIKYHIPAKLKQKLKQAVR